MSSSKIQWCDKVWNPTSGCTKVSSGCKNCYAVREAHRLSGNPNAKIRARFSGLTEKLPNGELNFTGRTRFVPEKLEDPLHWRKPQRVFVNSMSDLFHENFSNEEIAAVFGIMAACPQHTFQILTKRSKRMREWFEWGGCEEIYAHWIGDTKLEIQAWPLPNVWIGVSVEDQAAFEARIPDLFAIPAAVRFLSCEPLLDVIDLCLDLGWSHAVEGFTTAAAASENPPLPHRQLVKDLLSWVIVGGESGPGARACDVAWIHTIVDQCKQSGVACFVKQLGARAISKSQRGVKSDFELKAKKGDDPSEWPKTLRVQQFPGA